MGSGHTCMHGEEEQMHECFIRFRKFANITIFYHEVFRQNTAILHKMVCLLPCKYI